MAFIVGDKWQNYGLGTKMVDYVLEIAKEMGVERVFVIMLSDNYRAISLTKKMGFILDYQPDGTVKGTLNLKEEMPENPVSNSETTAQTQSLTVQKPASTSDSEKAEEGAKANLQ